jgi:CheY-like chemotaxis protein
VAKILIVEDSPDNMKLFRTGAASHRPDGHPAAGQGRAMSADGERALQAGFDDYITKPIDIRSFPEQVQAALAGHRAR